MVKVKDILREIEHYAPLPLQEGFDNAGVQVGDVNQHATGVLLCLDVTEEVLDEAIEIGYNLIISHHPLAFKSFKSLTGSNYIERCMMKACKYDLVVYAAHTNLDNAVGGVNYRLAELIGLQNVRILSPKRRFAEVGDVCPEAYAEIMRNTLFNAGAEVSGTMMLAVIIYMARNIPCQCGMQSVLWWIGEVHVERGAYGDDPSGIQEDSGDSCSVIRSPV